MYITKEKQQKFARRGVYATPKAEKTDTTNIAIIF